MSESTQPFETVAIPAQDENPYLFGDPATDRARLEAQTALFSRYLQQHAREFVGTSLTRILDLGCGEGQLTFMLARLYRGAQVIGIDKDTRALAQAQERAAKMEVTNITFVEGNVEEALPPGSFDLIYGSLIFVHLRRPAALIRHCYDHLAPGGYLWIKDLHPGNETVSEHPAYRRLIGLLYSTTAAIGGSPYLFHDAPSMLAAAGFAPPRITVEEYPLGGATTEGRVMLGNILGIIYNARGTISKIHQIPESEILQLYSQLGDWARHQPGEVGSFPWGNMIAQRPLDDSLV